MGGLDLGACQGWRCHHHRAAGRAGRNGRVPIAPCLRRRPQVGEALLQDFSARLWFTYRREFPAIGGWSRSGRLAGAHGRGGGANARRGVPMAGAAGP